MTINNLWLEDDRALLAVDTACVGDDGRQFHGTKLSVLAHAQCVIAGAGTHQALHVIAVTALQSPEVADFDSAADFVAQGINATFANLAAHVPGMANLQKQEVHLVGFSRRQQRMAAVSFKQESMQQGFARVDVTGGFLLPWGEQLGSPPDDLSTDDAMAALMHRQIMFTAKHHPQHLAGVGGSMIVAEITRNAIELRRRPLVGPL
jgi:hypothetical protein